MIALFINTSVDPVDPYGDSIPENLSLNEMETILEIVAEQILKIENCFEEKDEDDPEGVPPLKPIKNLSKIEPSKVITLNVNLALAPGLSKPQYTRLFISQFIGEVDSPPPESASCIHGS